jgi:hypothetical protein
MKNKDNLEVINQLINEIGQGKYNSYNYSPNQLIFIDYRDAMMICILPKRVLLKVFY